MNRRLFCKAAGLAAVSTTAVPLILRAAQRAEGIKASDLPSGPSPAALEFSHFPDRLHAFVWRNWSLAPKATLARVVGASTSEISKIARSMGLPPQKRISASQQKRTALTIIRRNWHLLPYEQLLQLLDWTPAQLAFALKEDDFLFIKLGSLKPRCDLLRYNNPAPAASARASQIAALVRQMFPKGLLPGPEPLFGFLDDLARSSARSFVGAPSADSTSRPRFCYSYYALYGDPLLEPELDPYPNAYLDQLRATGVNGVWLQAVLHQLSPFPWDERISRNWRQRLDNLRMLAARCRSRGIGLYLYLNEPRTMPLRFFESHPHLKGITSGDVATLCTSHPEVQAYIAAAVARITKAAPDLAGFFTITASENLTNCWSHGGGSGCPRCSKESPGATVAGISELIARGIRNAGSNQRVIAWDWGWQDRWVEDAITALPPEAALMSVSEWSIPIERGGTGSVVGEYSISVIGPGPRARKHWQLARSRGLRTLAKIQAGNTWELSAVPYIPAVENVARHLANLQAEELDGLMLGWTLGGFPSPNLEVVSEIEQGAGQVSVHQAMVTVASRRYGPNLAPDVVRAWQSCSRAFSRFPFHGGLVYTAPLQYGPSNLLWEKPTGYAATMVGFPYDDLNAWRAVYPERTFTELFHEISDGFAEAAATLKAAAKEKLKNSSLQEREAIGREINVIRACAIHFGTVSNQARFILARQRLAEARSQAEALPVISELEAVLHNELALAQELHTIQSSDSRIGFEASNQYYYVPLDLVEKVLNCEDLLKRWLPAQRGRFPS